MMKKYIYSIIPAIMIFIFVASCEFNKMPLPVPQTTTGGFSANDTSYIELNPVWDSSFLGTNLSHPTDITIGPDGYIFIADEGNNRVLVINKSGEIMSHNGLGSIKNIVTPGGIHIDDKLSVYISNGTNTIYAWNQYFNFADIDSVANKIVIRNVTTGDTLHVLLTQAYSQPENDDYVFQSTLFEKYTPSKHPVRDTYPFYTDSDINSQIKNVTANGNYVFASDYNNNRILKLALLPEWLIKTTEGFVLQKYVGKFVNNAVTFGSGAGTVDKPWSMTLDENNLYLSQLGGNFLVQKLKLTDFSSQYTLYQHPIMDLNRFVEPTDLTLDNVGNLFVLDTGAKKVYKFFNNGPKAGKLSDLGDRGISTVEFTDARGIMVSDNVIYIVESGENRIRRFEYSISDEDIPDDEKKP